MWDLCFIVDIAVVYVSVFSHSLKNPSLLTDIARPSFNGAIPITSDYEAYITVSTEKLLFTFHLYNLPPLSAEYILVLPSNNSNAEQSYLC